MLVVRDARTDRLVKNENDQGRRTVRRALSKIHVSRVSKAAG